MEFLPSSGCANTTLWNHHTLTKCIEKKLDWSCTRMLLAILNKSWKQHPTKQQVYGHLPPISKTIQIRWTRHAGHCWRSKDELISGSLFGPLRMDVPVLADQEEPIYNISVQTQDVWKTCWGGWMIGTDQERESEISELAAWLDDDDCLKSN